LPKIFDFYFSMASKKEQRAAQALRPRAPEITERLIEVRRSGIHGNGMFALRNIPQGQILIEYQGRIINWKEALRRHPHDPKQPNHTFYFSLEDGRVIDGNDDGNDARWINHACKPNCEADEDEQNSRVWIKALRDLKKGEELFYDYGLVIDEPYTKKLKADYQCLCGAKACRGTMLAKK
jgi:uncharacterized protein